MSMGLNERQIGALLHLTNGIAYYEPATQDEGRRLTFHTGDGDLVLETNLTRDQLLQVAATLPIRGKPLPARWRCAEVRSAWWVRLSVCRTTGSRVRSRPRRCS